MMVLKMDGGESVECHCLIVEVDGAVIEIVESDRERTLSVRAINRPLVIRPTGGANHIEVEVER